MNIQEIMALQKLATKAYDLINKYALEPEDEEWDDDENDNEDEEYYDDE